MIADSIAVLAFRVLALLAVLAAIGPGATVLPTLVREWPYDAGGGSSLLMLASLLAPIILPLVFASLLWYGADRLARSLHAGAQSRTAISLETLQAFSFSATGVFVLALAIPRITTLIYYYWQLSTPGGVEVSSDVERKAAVVETATRLLLGLWLLFGGSGIANFVRWIRGR